MPDQIYIGNFAKGLVKNPLPFNIDNDAFPTMYNFYTWRGRAKRKRGTVLLGQLQRQVKTATSPNAWQLAKIALLDGSGSASVNLISKYSLGNGSSITPGSFSLSDGTNTYTDDGSGTITGSPSGSGTINYATGALTIAGGVALQDLVGNFSYYPALPVMGLEDYITSSSAYPILVAFDTTYAYQYNDTTSNFYTVSYYKASNNPVTWSGTDYQQFWSTNYEGAFWVTNNKPGMQFENISAITVGNPTQITTGSAHGLVTGDYVFFNEITGTDANLLNLKAFSITKVDATNFTVAVDTTAKVLNNNGIFQTLTAKSTSGDGIRWYDGDMTNGTGIPTGTSTGWVNFAPPLTETVVSINNITAALYYLVGALAIVPFKDRLLFFSPWVQTSTGAAIQLKDTVIWSWNGTPYYCSPVPTNQTYDVTAYYVDVTGKGGFLSAGTSQSIVTVNSNEDVLLVGFTGRQTRFVYTGNDFSPFLFFNINSELGSSAPFSGINLDRGALTIGAYGIALTTQQSAQRIDLQIPDEVFQISATNNGALRVNGVRDFYREWIYFTYTPDNSIWVYPTRTFFYNYRENTWGIFYENFTTQGTYRRTTSYTWATLPFGTWAQWRESWDSGSTTAQFPSVIGGNQQGYVLIKGQGTGEGLSGTITALASSSGLTQITSYNHCVNVGDYLYIFGCLGTTSINRQIGKVISTADANTFVIDLSFPAGNYKGLGKFARLSQPLIQTKQFPFYWNQGRQLRLGVQKYLMDFTANAQVTVNLYLSQDPDDVWNDPTTNVPPNSLVYSQLMYTCPESTNIGLTAPNTNLQMPTAEGQFQIWHRFNTSLIGDSVQVGITLSDAQMRNLTYATSEISLHGIQLTVYPGPHLA